jgi:glycosyltransferase involved in cell wall biosynthesis
MAITKRSLDVSIVTAVYRNAETVEELFTCVARILDRAGLSFEMVFVNDACPAGSEAALARLAAADARVRVITNPTNLGQDRSLVAGMRASLGEVVVLMDADLQDDPAAIPRLVDHLAGGTGDIVFAGRRGSYESRSRLATSFLYKRTLALLTPLPPDAGLFIALSRHVADALAQQPTACPWLLPRLATSGLRLDSLPFARASRRDGGSAYSAWRRLHKGVSSMLWTLALRTRARRTR